MGPAGSAAAAVQLLANFSAAPAMSGSPVAWPHDLGVARPVDAGDVLELSLVFLAGTLAAAAGVGGGAIYTPLYIILFGLVYEAVPLSKAAVCGAAIAFFLFNLWQPVPSALTRSPNRFAYDAVMIMEPATMLGTVFGVMASRVCPMWLITIAMALLLYFSANSTFRKANKLYARENDQAGRVVKRNPTSGDIESTQSLVPSQVRGASGTYGSVSVTNGAQTASIVADVAPIGYSEWLGWRCSITVGICFAALLGAAMLANDRVLPSFTSVDCGSLSFWGVIVLNSAICAVITAWNLRFLVSNVQPHIRAQCAVNWTPRTGLRYSALCLVAGFMSALCGIGGSTIKGPILLEMGLHPTLSKATSQFMLLTTVTSSALQFYFSDALPPVYGLVFFALGALSGFTGKWLVDTFVRYNGRQSTIVYLLAWYIVIAAVIMVSIGFIIVLGQLEPTVNWTQLGFRSVCDPLPDDLGALKWLTNSNF